MKTAELAPVMALDEAQRSVVDHDGGPLLVLGGPGTGKTTVLVERWVSLATDRTEPHRVLLLVPTRERALELRDELPYRLPHPAVLEVPVHTWHALAYHLVTRYYRSIGYAQPPVRLTSAEQWTVVRDLLGREDAAAWGRYADHLTTEAFTSEVADFCVRAGYRGMDDAGLTELAERRPEHGAIARFAITYRRHLREQCILDYPELIAAAARLLQTDEGIRETVRRRFTHVLVDDAQELAPAQLHLLRELNCDHLVCAGDPDSAIEAFRGADPFWLERFADLAPAHDRVVLPTAHRFGKTIGDTVANLIGHGPDEGPHRPTTYADKPGSSDLICYATMAGEIESAARAIRAAHVIDGVPYERMAVLLAQPGTYVHPLKRVLTSLDVPYRIDSGDRPLADEPGVRGVLDLCRAVLFDEASDDRAKAVLNSMLIGLHPYEIRELERDAFRTNVDLIELLDSATGDGRGARGAPDGLAEFRKLRDVARERADDTADATFAAIFNASAWCNDLVERRSSDREAAHQLDALIAFSRALAHFVERRGSAPATMRDYLETAAESGTGFATDTWVPSPGGADHSGVHLLSFHASKGAEWDVVCVLGVAEGLIPRAHRAQGLFDPWALDAGSPVDRAQAQLAEERRTLYVALSRATDRLIVSCSPGTRRAVPSRFLEEAFGTVPDPVVATDDLPPLTVGEAVARHRRTLAHPDATGAQKAAAAVALAGIDGIDPSQWWWRRELTDGQPLVPGGRLTTSYSRIGRYDNCPLQYVLESVLGLDPASTYQMKFGSLIHKIFELVDAGDLKTDEEVNAYYRREFMEEEHFKSYPNRQFAATYFKAGAKMLKLWWTTERRRDVLRIEYSFNDLDVEGHTIRGRIDRITKESGPNGAGLVLTDYKTSKSAVSYDEARESLQLAIYYRAAQVYDDLSEHGPPVRMELVYPGIERRDRDDGHAFCERRVQKPEHAQEALVKLKTFLDAAAAEQFSPSPEADCRWCRMKILCPRWPEGKDIPR